MPARVAPQCADRGVDRDDKGHTDKGRRNELAQGQQIEGKERQHDHMKLWRLCSLQAHRRNNLRQACEIGVGQLIVSRELGADG